MEQLYMVPTKHDFYVAIAIDFGTSRSGFAYAFPDKEPVKVHGNFKWLGSNLSYPKTATRLLYNPTKDVTAWGFEAKETLAKLRKNDRDRIAQGQPPEAPHYFFFERFKIDLIEGHKRYGRPYRQEQGEDFDVVDLVADYLHELKEFALAQILPGD